MSFKVLSCFIKMTRTYGSQNGDFPHVVSTFEWVFEEEPILHNLSDYDNRTEQWCRGLLRSWMARASGEQAKVPVAEIEELSLHQFDEILLSFFQIVCKSNGDHFRATTLTRMFNSFNHCVSSTND
jgi:hypothetical protein